MKSISVFKNQLLSLHCCGAFALNYNYIRCKDVSSTNKSPYILNTGPDTKAENMSIKVV